MAAAPAYQQKIGSSIIYHHQQHAYSLSSLGSAMAVSAARRPQQRPQGTQ